jgi:hypothetical protein
MAGPSRLVAKRFFASPSWIARINQPVVGELLSLMSRTAVSDLADIPGDVKNLQRRGTDSAQGVTRIAAGFLGADACLDIVGQFTANLDLVIYIGIEFVTDSLEGICEATTIN